MNTSKILLDRVIKLAHDVPETRKYLVPLLRTAHDHMLEERDAYRTAAYHYGMTPERWVRMTNPEKLAALRKVAHKPLLESMGLNKAKVRADEAFMVYLIDPSGNHSKFYEAVIVPDQGGFRIIRRWGALTDSGRTGRIDGAKFDKDPRFWFGDLRSAKRELASHYAKRISHGYVDAFGPNHKSPITGKKLPMGQYPVGLKREVGFGWGTQSVTQCIPGLKDLHEQIAQAQAEIARQGRSDIVVGALEEGMRLIRSIAHEDSSMGRILMKLIGKPLRRAQGSPRFLPDPTGKALRQELNRLSRYLEKQLSYCE